MRPFFYCHEPLREQMLKNHRESKRKCPGCKKTKLFDVRTEACSKTCADTLKLLRASKAPVVIGETETETLIKAYLTKHRFRATIGELSDFLDRSEVTVRAALDSLRTKSLNFTVLPGNRVAWDSDVKPGGTFVIKHDMKKYDGGWRVFGACGDNHLGSHHERLDVLNALYDIYEKEGVTQVFNTGNWIEGEMRLNHHDVKVFGLDDQVNYMLDKYPQRPGITTYFIAGDDHEGWYQRNNRMVIGAHVERMARERGRSDLIYLGYVEADVELQAKNGSCWMKVMHPGGGSAYAHSYAPQKLAESFQGGEKPAVLLIGHYHKIEYCFPREIHTVQTGCTVDQSIFMRKCKIQAHVGGTLIRLHQAPDGTINRFQPEFFTFYDRDFYEKKRNFDVSGRKNPAGLNMDKLQRAA